MPRAKLVLLVSLLLTTAAAHAQEQQSIEVPMKGLSYSMLSKNGVTVMAAQLHYNVLNYTTVQVWISNGSKVPVRISPRYFEIRVEGSGGFSNGSDDGQIIDEIQQRVKPKDLSDLIHIYETTLYGFANDKSVGYYERRKNAVMANMGNGGRLRATATAAAIVLPDKFLKPGEAMDGTVFFRMDHAARITAIGAHIGGAIYDFPQSAPEEHVH